MNSFFVTAVSSTITDFDKIVNYYRKGMGEADLIGELVGGPFAYAGMVCQSMLMIRVEEETEHEEDDSSDNNG